MGVTDSGSAEEIQTLLMTTQEVYGRPCRACNDFKSFMKNVPTPGGQTEGGGETVARDDPHHQCPPDRMELGSRSWSLLHSVAAYFPSQPTLQQQEDARNFMHLFSRLYPCSDCAEDMRSDLAESPPQVTSASEFSLWLCQLHNKVNIKLGKPEFDCSKVFQRWRDGWDDGSCD